jgi:hypothetical protein
VFCRDHPHLTPTLSPSAAEREKKWIHPRDLGAADVVAFLNHLANVESVAAGTQNQALNAISFLYADIQSSTASAWQTPVKSLLPVNTRTGPFRIEPASRKSSPGGPRFAQRKSLMGKLICGGLGKPLDRGEGERKTTKFVLNDLPHPMERENHSPHLPTLFIKGTIPFLREIIKLE